MNLNQLSWSQSNLVSFVRQCHVNHIKNDLMLATVSQLSSLLSYQERQTQHVVVHHLLWLIWQQIQQILQLVIVLGW
jgi:hypothetical protein